MNFIFIRISIGMGRHLFDVTGSCSSLAVLLLYACMPSLSYAQQRQATASTSGEAGFAARLNLCFPQASDVAAHIVAYRQCAIAPAPLVVGSEPFTARTTAYDGATREAETSNTAWADSADTKEVAYDNTGLPDVPARPGNDASAAHLSLFETEKDLAIYRYAEMVDLDAADLHNMPLYRFIDAWYGTRYKFGGTDNNGIDCSAFSQKLCGTIYNTPIPRTARQQYKACEIEKEEEGATEGDLVFFRVHRLRISHVGVYLANGYFVHASRSQGVVISNLNDKYWHRRYAGYGKVAHAGTLASESDFIE